MRVRGKDAGQPFGKRAWINTVMSSWINTILAMMLALGCELSCAYQATIAHMGMRSVEGKRAVAYERDLPCT
jgi:hypothetical protein